MERKKRTKDMKVIARFCHVDEKCCPQLCFDKDAEKSKQIVIVDDFGGSVHMSKKQMLDFIEKVRIGQIVI